MARSRHHTSAIYHHFFCKFTEAKQEFTGYLKWNNTSVAKQKPVSIIVPVPLRVGISLRIVDFFKFHAIVFLSTLHNQLFFTLLTLLFFLCVWFHGPLELWKHNHRSCLFIMRPGSEIIFLLVFHSHHRYLFRREKNLELYIVILLYRKKKKTVS